MFFSKRNPWRATSPCLNPLFQQTLCNAKDQVTGVSRSVVQKFVVNNISRPVTAQDEHQNSNIKQVWTPEDFLNSPGSLQSCEKSQKKNPLSPGKLLMAIEQLTFPGQPSPLPVCKTTTKQKKIKVSWSLFNTCRVDYTLQTLTYPDPDTHVSSGYSHVGASCLSSSCCTIDKVLSADNFVIFYFSLSSCLVQLPAWTLAPACACNG